MRVFFEFSEFSEFSEYSEGWFEGRNLDIWGILCNFAGEIQIYIAKRKKFRYN